jgi:hypothetical protein
MSSKFDPKKDKKYHPVNSEKYMGKTRFAVCRSSWETAVCRWMDANPSVVQWKSEPFGIPYIDPSQLDKRGRPKKRMYYPDFLAKIQSKNGFHIWLIEVKPYKETIPPKASTRKKQQTKLYEARAWEVNQAKWKAARAYCSRKGWSFKILTEKQILR